MNKIWFISDLHFHHRSIMKYCNERLLLSNAKDENDVEAMDKWLIGLWNSTVGKKDEVYILGDFSFYNVEDTKKLLGKLNGKKFLILGNHDRSSEHLEEYFEQITLIKEKNFKKKNFPFLNEDFRVVMCHYPMLDWPSKEYGTIMVHGHCHGNMDEINSDSEDLRVDVGLDGELACYNFISLEKLYETMEEKKRENLEKDIYIKVKL